MQNERVPNDVEHRVSKVIEYSSWRTHPGGRRRPGRGRRLSAAFAIGSFGLTGFDVLIFVNASTIGTMAERQMLFGLWILAAGLALAGVVAAIISLRRREGGWVWLALNGAVALVTWWLLIGLAIAAAQPRRSGWME